VLYRITIGAILVIVHELVEPAFDRRGREKIGDIFRAFPPGRAIRSARRVAPIPNEEGHTLIFYFGVYKIPINVTLSVSKLRAMCCLL
jgi:hypothetical protein